MPRPLLIAALTCGLQPLGCGSVAIIEGPIPTGEEAPSGDSGPGQPGDGQLAGDDALPGGNALPGDDALPGDGALPDGDAGVEATGEMALQAAALTVSESAGELTVSVLRQNGTTGTASVWFTTRYLGNDPNVANPAEDVDWGNGNDYRGAYGELQFLAGEVETSFTITLFDNSVADGDRVFRVELYDASTALGEPSQGMVTILDDEEPIPGPCVDQPAGQVCRPAANDCDLAETCDGAAEDCPPDRFVADETPCAGGVCVAGSCRSNDGWTRLLSFDTMGPDSNCVGSAGFVNASSANGTTTVTTAEAFGGSGKSCLVTVNPSTQDAIPTLVLPLGGAMRQGDEIWVRWRLLTPSGFSWEAHRPRSSIIKVLRFTPHHNVAHLGRLSLLFADNGNYPDDLSDSGWYPVGGWEAVANGTVPNECSPYFPVMTSACTVGPWDCTAVGEEPIELPSNRGGTNLNGEWHTYEVSIAWSAEPDGGHLRFWLDGSLQIEWVLQTMLDADDILDTKPFFFSTWNGGVDVEKQIYIDDVQLTTARPTARDRHGNAFLGLD